MPKLLEEFEKRRAVLQVGYKWPDLAARKSPQYKAEMWKACGTKVGGKPEERLKFFEEVIAAYPECF